MSIENIQERVNVSGRVDRGAGIIRGVKILGRVSRNGRTYSETAMREAVPLYEGAKVNVNHPPKSNPNQPREYGDRIGTLRGVSAKADGLYGDLHYNPKHALAEQLAWDAEHSPESAGLSHNVDARTSRKDGKTIIEAILKVHSVDLVADPATVGGLYEAVEPVAEVEVVDTRTYAEALRGEPIPSKADSQAYVAKLRGERLTESSPESARQYAEALRRR